MNNSFIWLLILIAGGLFILWFIHKHFKRLKLPSVYLISGAVKTGKTKLSVCLAVKQYKKNVRKYRIGAALNLLLPKKFKKQFEKPMLYSNIPLRYVKHNRLTIDIILRKKRMPYGSVVLIDEASLLADSQLFNDQFVNETLMLFFKLFAHETMGGTCIINTQSYSDLHYAIKRCVGQYLYIHNSKQYPLISVFNVREMITAEDGTNAVNNFSEDMEYSLTKILVLNKYHKYYDRYCYSVFTDELMLDVNYDQEVFGKHDSLKCNVLVTLQDFKTLGDFQEKLNFEIKRAKRERKNS